MPKGVYNRQRKASAPADDAKAAESPLTFSKWTTNEESGARSMLVRKGQEVVGRIAEATSDDNPDAERFEVQIDGRNPIVASTMEEAKTQANALLGVDYDAEMARAAEQNRAKLERMNKAR